MKLALLAPAELFRDRFEVPPFQRVYRWTPLHWSELWTSLRDRTVLRMAGRRPRRLFLGVIVLDTPPGIIRAALRREIVDGQHRLTTLQLVLGAARNAAVKLDCPTGEARFQEWIYDPENRLRLRSNDADHQTFKLLMGTGAPVVPGKCGIADQSIAEAYRYFHEEVWTWLRTFDPNRRPEAIQALQATFERDLRFLVFDLERTLLWRVFYRLFAHRVWPEPAGRANSHLGGTSAPAHS